MKKFISGMCIGLIAGMSATIIAAGTFEQIDVLRNDITVKVNGEVVDADNFVYNDTTYLPLRAIGEKLGLDVQYDEATNTALIGAKKPASSSSNTEQRDYEFVRKDKYEDGDVVAGGLKYFDLLITTEKNNPYGIIYPELTQHYFGVRTGDITDYISSIGFPNFYLIGTDGNLYDDKNNILLSDIKMSGYENSCVDVDYWNDVLYPFIQNLAKERGLIK